MRKLLILLSALVFRSLADLFTYVDTNAATVGESNLNTLLIPLVQSEFITSKKYLSGTVDTVFVTFVGDFSSSGPHSVGSFQVGSTTIVDTQLDRTIGNLESVLFQKNGTDGWLLASMRCKMINKRYEFNAPVQWLDNFDPASFPANGDGYEPLAHSTIPASSQMQLDVNDVMGTA